MTFLRRSWALTRGLAPAAALWLALGAASSRPTPAPEASPTASPAVRAGYEKAAGELLCYCGCARQTIRDCTCGVAFDLRQQFETRLANGGTAESVIDAYIAEHGEQSRNVPPKKGLNLLAWFGPGIAILLAGAATIVVILIWARRGRRAAVPVQTATPPAGEETIRKRLEDELREFDA